MFYHLGCLFSNTGYLQNLGTVETSLKALILPIITGYTTVLKEKVKCLCNWQSTPLVIKAFAGNVEEGANAGGIISKHFVEKD